MSVATLARPLVTADPTTARVAWMLRAYWLILITSALDAYALGPVPINWIGQLMSVAVALYLVGKEAVRLPPGGIFWPVLLGWGSILTIAMGIIDQFANRMPPYATTSYPLFIGLRMLSYIGVISQIVLITWLIQHGARSMIVKHTLQIGMYVGLFAIYVYAAHRFGLPEPPRTRIGTHGDGQAVFFTYAFHRALGSFREPSLLAAWSVTPLMLCFAEPRRIALFPALSLTVALLLSGSLTGFLGLAAGAVIATVSLVPYTALPRRFVIGGGVILAAGCAAFSTLAVANDDGSTNLVQVIWERIEPMLNDGLSGSNRVDVYDALEVMDTPVLGVGFGNANLLLSEASGSDMVCSFLNLYATTLYAVGWPGLIFLLVALGSPLLVARAAAARAGVNERQSLWILSVAYGSWLPLYYVLFEEPQFMYAVSFALVTSVSPQRSIRPEIPASRRMR